jgi:hypothetical protein
MSQSVAYTPPEYVPPEILTNSWTWDERRSQDPVNLLGRSLNRLCLEASDPYEIVAHLEALGFNSPTALARFGMTSHFELAHELFRRTPRIRERREPKKKSTRDLATPIAMGLAFVVTFVLGAFSQIAMLAPALVVLIWSQGGAALLMKARGELQTGERQDVLAALVQLGALAILLSWVFLRFGVATFAPTLTWFAVGSLLWGERYLAAIAMPLVVGLSLVATALLPVPDIVPQYVAIVVALALCVPLAWRNPRGVVGWLRSSAAVTLHPLLYGIGQGLLIVALLRRENASDDVVPGAVLLLLILLLSQRLLIALKTLLTKRLWHSTSEPGFQRFAQLALLGYVGTYVLPLLAAFAFELLSGPTSWHFHWYAFGLFGLSLGIAVVGFALGLPAGASIPFLIAGVAAAAGLPFLWVCLALALSLLLVAEFRVRQVGRYAIYLL